MKTGSLILSLVFLAGASCGSDPASVLAGEASSRTVERLNSTPVVLSTQWPGAYPRLARLADGSLLGTVTAVVNGVHHLRTVSSRDNGATFSDLGEIAQGTGDLDNVHVTQLATTAAGASTARILAAFRNHSQGPSGYVYRITVTRSDDGGRTWVFHSEVENSTPPNGLWEPFLLVAPDGSLHVYYARELAGNDQDIVMRRSTDGGVTWSARSIVAGAGITSRDGMPGVAAYWRGGAWTLQAIFESNAGQGFQVMGVSSSDVGATWQNRSAIHTPPQGHNSGSPQIARAGRHLVAVYMTDEDSTTVNWPNQASIKAQTGFITDRGIAWRAAQTVSGASSYWPGVIARDAQSALCTFSQATTVATIVPLFFEAE